MNLTKFGLGAAAAMLISTATYAAECGPSGQSVRVLGSDFPAIQAVTGTAEANCASAAGEYTTSLRDNTRDIMNQALTPNPAEYSSVVVANSTLAQLMADGLVRPLDDLVAKYGDNLKPNQLITIDGQIMAVAFMANSQHLFARSDMLEEAGVEGIPSTYEDVIAAAEAIRAAGIMEYPIVANMKSGWNLGEAFNMMYLGHGGSFFKPGTAEPAINNETGVAALEMMKQVAEYTNPDFLTMASNETQATWEAGQAALGIMWGSRGGVILDDEGSTAEVTSNTVLAAAPTVAGGDTPAATLWWDGFTISTNVSDEDAEATFAALTSAMTPEMVAANNDDAIWLLDGFQPGPAAAGVSATAATGKAQPYPMTPFINLLHNSLGAELVDFIQGNESAEQALADVEAAYITAAKEQGYIQ
ncbi:MAG: extracellular solute-binding protein [Pseudomonadota bacterium]